MKLFKLIYPYAAVGYALLEVGYDVNYAFAARGEWRWWMKLARVSVIRDDGSLSESEVSARTSIIAGQFITELQSIRHFYPPALFDSNEPAGLSTSSSPIKYLPPHSPRPQIFSMVVLAKFA